VALGSPVAGRAYFITNDDAQPFWGFVGDVLQPLGYGRPRIKLPFSLVFFIACVFEFLVSFVKYSGKKSTAGAHSVLRLIAASHFYPTLLGAS